MATMLMQPASPSTFKSSFSPKSTTTTTSSATGNSYLHQHHPPHSYHHYNSNNNNNNNNLYHHNHYITTTTNNNTNANLLTPLSSQQQQQQHTSDNYQFNLLYKRQEANYYVQQILTDLLAIGVLEYESGFDNAINRTYKVRKAFFGTTQTQKIDDII